MNKKNLKIEINICKHRNKIIACQKGVIYNFHLKKCTNLKIIFFTPICHNSIMFQSILIIFRMLLTINKNLHKNKKKDGLLNILKFVHKMFVDIVK